MGMQALEIFMGFVTFGSILPNLPKAISSFRQKHLKLFGTLLTGFSVLSILQLSECCGRRRAWDKPHGKEGV